MGWHWLCFNGWGSHRTVGSQGIWSAAPRRAETQEEEEEEKAKPLLDSCLASSLGPRQLWPLGEVLVLAVPWKSLQVQTFGIRRSSSVTQLHTTAPGPAQCTSRVSGLHTYRHQVMAVLLYRLEGASHCWGLISLFEFQVCREMSLEMALLRRKP